MPGSTAAWTEGWGGREPLAAVAARALAPWPVWIVLLGSDGGVGRGLGFLVVSALVVSMMAWRAGRGADRTLGAGAVGLVVALAVGASLFLSVVASLAGVHAWDQSWLASALFGWLSGALLYEVGKRCLAQPDLEPPARVARAIDVIAHQLVLVAPLAGVVELDAGGAPLALLVGPLVAVRVAGWHDARMPPPHRTQLGTRVVFGLAATAILVGALVQQLSRPCGGAGASAAVVWVVVAAAASALLAAVVLAVRAERAAKSLWGVVREHRPDGIVLAVAGGTEHVHVVPKAPKPGGGLPDPEAPITFLDAEPVPGVQSPYRGGPPVVRARVAWRGTADELAASLLSRAWGWLAWSALSFAAAVHLLG